MRILSPLTLALALFVGASPAIAQEESTRQREIMKQDEATMDQRASQRIPSQAQRRGNEIVVRSTEVYRSALKHPKGEIPQTVLNNAKCIAIFPGVVTAALAVGGTHGNGVAFCKNDSGGWGSPVFLDMTAGSIGVQAGVRNADIVLFMTGDNARRSIQEGRFRIGGEVSAVAGEYGRSFEIPREGVVAYSRTSGVFAGASLDAVDLRRDDDEARSFYGSSWDSSKAFTTQIPDTVESSVSELKRLLPA